MSRERSAERGQIIVLVALSLVVLLLLAGLAIDGAIAYNVKAKLSAAVDGAALAAGRAGFSNAVTTAQNFFRANFPSGYMGATVRGGPNPNITGPTPIPADKSWDITISAQATVPTFFLRVAGMDSFTAAASAKANRKDLDLALVIDTSGSLSAVISSVRDGAIWFVRQMDSNRDRLALIHFASGARVDTGITNGPAGYFDSGIITGQIGGLLAEGGTNYAEALWKARAQLESVTNKAGFRAIVFFTDGAPNCFTAQFITTRGAQNLGVLCSNDSPNFLSGLYLTGAPNTNGNAICFNCNEANFLSRDPSIHALPAFFSIDGTNSGFGITVNTVGYPNAYWRNTGTQISSVSIDQSSRNLAESMAWSFRQPSPRIYIFTIGFNGNGNLTNNAFFENVTGAMVLKRMANDPSADTYQPNQPAGMYCQANTTADIQPCFSAIASRLSRLKQ